ncbi:MAG TPA: AEC family transporter [Clostridia bacterium]|nr:AEC family transporter [Clostridia bacterium]
MQRMANTQALLFLYALTGVLMRRIGILKAETRGAFVSLFMNITLPCMILASFDQVFTSDQLRDAGTVLLLSTGVLVLSGLTAFLLFRKKPDAERSVLYFATLFSNSGNAGMPVASLVYGPAGVFYASIYLIPARLAMYTLGVALYAGKPKDKGAWAGIWTLLKIPTVAVIPLGLLLMLSGHTLPVVLGDAVRNIGDMTAPLAMMLIGASLADGKPRELLERPVLWISFVRLILMPALCWGLLSLAGMQSLPVAVTVTLVAMPVAANTAILAEQYGADNRFASRCVFLSTVLSLVTVPAITLLMELTKGI